MRTATLDDATNIFRVFADRFHRAGWILTLYGSTLRTGSGKDVDFIAVNWRERPMPPDMVLTDIKGDAWFNLRNGAFDGVESAVVQIGDIRVDIQFREARIGRP